MSSFRNAVKRKTHKERSQPESRAKLGLLEKKKDYKIRAENYKEKKNLIKKLQIEAAFKNPFEFNRGMLKTQLSEDGKHIAKKETLDDITIGKNQVHNLAYLNMLRQQELKKIEKLKANLHFITKPAESSDLVKNDIKAKRTLFFDDEEEVLHYKQNKRKRNEMAEKLAEAESVLDRERKKGYDELASREKRLQQLNNYIANIDVSKNLRKKEQHEIIEEAKDGKPAIVKWRRERKK